MEDLEALWTLLQLTTKARKLVDSDADTDRIFAVIRMLRNLARVKNSALARQIEDHRHFNGQLDVYRLCLVGIGTECRFDIESLPGKADLLIRLKRVESYLAATFDHLNQDRTF